MSVIDNVMKTEAARWIGSEIKLLPNKAKYRAFSSIRALKWANNIYDSGMPIPASYCALHATEEAVAAFVSCLKVCGYGENAKVNIKDHREKSVISILAQNIASVVQKYNPAVAVDQIENKLLVRITSENREYIQEASTTSFYFRADDDSISKDFYPNILNSFGDIETLKRAIDEAQRARLEIFYASDTGYPKGFDEPEKLLRRECHLCLALLWATVDVYAHKETQIPFIVQALNTIKLIKDSPK